MTKTEIDAPYIPAKASRGMLSFDWLASAVKLYAGTGNAFDWLETEPSDFGGKHQWRAGCVSVVF